MSDASTSSPPPELAPIFDNMPLVTKVAVVPMWLMFGFGVYGSVALAVRGPIAASRLDLSGLPGWLVFALILGMVQLVVWTVLRGVFARRICRRSGSGRTGAVILESIGLGLTALLWFVTTIIGSSSWDESHPALSTEVTISTNPSGIGGSYGGIVLSILVIVLLSLRDSRRWCDR